jgi:hypothetical protein
MDQDVTLSPTISFYMNKKYVRMLVVDYNSAFNPIDIPKPGERAQGHVYAVPDTDHPDLALVPGLSRIL